MPPRLVIALLAAPLLVCQALRLGASAWTGRAPLRMQTEAVGSGSICRIKVDMM